MEKFKQTIERYLLLIQQFLFLDYNCLNISYDGNKSLEDPSNKINLELKYFNSSENKIFKVILYDYTTGKNIEEWHLIIDRNDEDNEYVIREVYTSLKE